MLPNRKMLLGLTTVAGLGFPGVCGSVRADPFLPVPPASFLNYHVSTARGLSEEVAQDVVVRGRLARHFGMSASAVASYVRANLVETALTARQAGRYRVACISPSGREYFVSERLAAGTPVFALASTGQPILRLACGNPLTAALPPVPPKPISKPALLSLSPKVLPAASVPGGAVSAEAVTPPTSFMLPETGSAGPVVQVAAATQSLGGGKGGFLFPVLFGAAGVGVLSGHHGSSPSPVTPDAPIPVMPIIPVAPITPVTPTIPVTPTSPPELPAPPTDTPQAAVPEPSSLLLFGIFGSAIIGLQLKARRRQR